MKGMAKYFSLWALLLFVVPARAEADAGEGKESCRPTVENIEGPYYRSGAPERERIYSDEKMAGSRLLLAGRVLNMSCRPLEGAIVEIWQTGPDGEYDFSERFEFRGRTRTDAKGVYRFETMVPGRYSAGGSTRPGHIHLKASHPLALEVTTQVYFEGDPYLEQDPFVRKSLVVPLAKRPALLGKSGQIANFDIVLSPRGMK